MRLIEVLALLIAFSTLVLAFMLTHLIMNRIFGEVANIVIIIACIPSGFIVGFYGNEIYQTVLNVLRAF